MPDAVAARLVALLREDPVPEVRREAARALGAVASGDPSAVGPLIDALEDGNDGVRRAATLALGRVRHREASEALLTALGRHPELWQEASAALATAGDRAGVPRLEALLDADSSQVRRGAVRALAALARGRALEDDGPVFVYTDDEGHRHPLF